ncbi:MAG: YcbK family protein [Polyangiaceae bacterium]
MRAVSSFAVLALVLAAPAAATAATPKAGRHARTARVQKVEAKTCTKQAIEVLGAGESATLPLARCDGSVLPVAVDQLSLLARPPSAAKPKVTVAALGKTRGAQLAPGIRRIDARLVERLEQVVDHFRKGGAPTKVTLVSGYRPKSAGSYHQTGRAIDFHLEGVTNEALVAFCKTMTDTGCGYYPNSTFVHMDVRDRGAGHVAWIDVSRPGEAPKYVSAWPIPGDDASKLPALPSDEPTAVARRAGAGAVASKHTFIF